jgi:hypothetical protein
MLNQQLFLPFNEGKSLVYAEIPQQNPTKDQECKEDCQHYDAGQRQYGDAVHFLRQRNDAIHVSSPL